MNYGDLNIVYEDNHILVVVKPQNVPSQQDESGDADMLSLLKQYLKETYNKTGNVYLGLVHRLDRPTGGVMVFAKTSKAATRLSESMRNGEFEKKYLCVCVGRLKNKTETLVNFLKKNPVNNVVYVANEATDGAKRAELSYSVVQEKDGLSLVKVQLATGRSHQIRVQLANIGNPIFADAKYCTEIKTTGIPLNLWAYSLKFIHPTKNEKMAFIVMPPNEREAWKRFDIKQDELY